MTRNETDRLTRRTMIALAGTTTTALVAGCLGDDDDDGDYDEAWDDVDEISFLGSMNDGWVGVEPDVIVDETNPTLFLVEGREYELTWENDDGRNHNLEILDGSRETLEETDFESEEGTTQSLTFEATAEMAEYYCNPHPNSMIGDIDVRSD